MWALSLSNINAYKSHYYFKKRVSELTEVNESHHYHETDPETTYERSQTKQQPSQYVKGCCYVKPQE